MRIRRPSKINEKKYILAWQGYKRYAKFGCLIIRGSNLAWSRKKNVYSFTGPQIFFAGQRFLPMCFSTIFSFEIRHSPPNKKIVETLIE